MKDRAVTFFMQIEHNEKSNKVQSVPTEYLEGDVTLEELIAFFEAMHDAFIEMNTKGENSG